MLEVFMDIDIVIPWVDGSDKKWLREKEKYTKDMKKGESTHEARFRDWNQLKYVLRSIELNLPWVHKIFLVTARQVPQWLKKDTGKLKIVFHDEFIPAQYLPTFSSHTIELNIHRIPNLSEHFIYFNDDIFVLNPMQPSDFFRNGLPCDNALLHIHCPKKSLMIHTIAHNDAGVINEHFNIHKVMFGNLSKWFCYRYGLKNLLWNVFLSVCPRFPGFRQNHLANSYLKSTFFKVWDEEFDYLNSVCLNKFREVNDVNQWVMREWQLASNCFYPYNKFKYGKMIDFEKRDFVLELNDCKKTILSSKLKMICINDGDTIENFEQIRDEVNQLLEKKFPKSSFEK